MAATAELDSIGVALGQFRFGKFRSFSPREDAGFHNQGRSLIQFHLNLFFGAGPTSCSLTQDQVKLVCLFF